MRFKYLAVVDATKALVVSATTVTLAYAGFSYWSLVIGTILSSALPTLLIVARHPVRFRWPRRAELADAIHYTGNFLVGNISWYVYSNADFAVAGRILGKGPLGDYTLGWTLASAPIERIAGVVNRVLPPLFSAVSTDKAMLRRYLLKITQALSLIAVPAAVGLALVAGDFTRVVLGEKWAGAIGPLRILAFYALLQTLQLVTPPVLMVTGNIRISARIGLATAAVLPIGFLLGGLTFGTVGIAATWVTLYPVTLFFMYRAAFRVIDLDAREYARALVPSVVAALVMVLAVELLGQSGLRLDGMWLLVAKIAVGAATYGIVLVLGWKRRLREMVNAIRLLK
jgi:O-antigen/teichoic acid export membrane protein